MTGDRNTVFSRLTPGRLFKLNPAFIWTRRLFNRPDFHHFSKRYFFFGLWYFKGLITWGGLARLAGMARFAGISVRLWNTLKINFAITWKNFISISITWKNFISKRNSSQRNTNTVYSDFRVFLLRNSPKRTRPNFGLKVWKWVWILRFGSENNNWILRARSGNGYWKIIYNINDFIYVWNWSSTL